MNAAEPTTVSSWFVILAQWSIVVLSLARADLVLVTLLPALAGVASGALSLVWSGRDPAAPHAFQMLLAVMPLQALALWRVRHLLARRHDSPRRWHPSVFLAALTAVGGLLILDSHLTPGTGDAAAALVAASVGFVLVVAALPPALKHRCQACEAQAREQADTLHARSTFDARLEGTCALYALHGPAVEQFVRWKIRLDPMFRALDTLAPPQGTVLDLGCGLGATTHWLLLGRPALKGIGFDMDTRKLAVARATTRLNPRAQFEVRDIGRAPYPECDCVLLLDVLHYLPQAAKREVLGGVRAALRPGGVLLFRDAQAESSWAHRKVAWLEAVAVGLGRHQTRHPLEFATLDQHRAWLREAGFTDIQVHAGTGRGSNLLVTAKRPVAET